MNGLDYILLLIIAWGALDGYRRGLIPVLLRFTGLVLATLFALKLASSLATFVVQKWMVRDHVIQLLNQYVHVPTLGEPTAELAVNQTATFSEYIGHLILGRLTSTIAPGFVGMTADLVILIASFLVLLCIALTVLAVASGFLTRILIKLVGHSGNRLLGIIAGACRSIIVVCLLVATALTFATLPPFHGLSGWIMTSRLSAGALWLIDHTWPLLYGAFAS